MKIVYCGDLSLGGTCRMRLNALASLGHAVKGVDTTSNDSTSRRLVGRILRRMGWEPDFADSNRALLRATEDNRPELVWIDKGLCISPSTLKQIRAYGSRLLHYSPDCMTNHKNQSKQFLQGVPLYDLHVTTKSYNVAERLAMGAKEVLFVNNAYCASVHQPIIISADERKKYGGIVGFIGAFERQRAQTIWYLVRNGISVRVWGSGWKTWHCWHRNPLLTVEHVSLWNNEYVKAICSFDINLGFLRKVNRDTQTTRSVEIPACAAFLMAERTNEHQQLFREGCEAEYFDSNEELLTKCRLYIAHPERRLSIAAAGRARCVSEDYSYAAHVDRALMAVGAQKMNIQAQ